MYMWVGDNKLNLMKIKEPFVKRPFDILYMCEVGVMSSHLTLNWSIWFMGVRREA